MGRLKIRRTDERNEAIWTAYNELIDELGDKANAVSMQWKYTEIGNRFFLTPKTVANILSQKMREHNAGNKREIREIHRGEQAQAG